MRFIYVTSCLDSNTREFLDHLPDGQVLIVVEGPYPLEAPCPVVHKDKTSLTQAWSYGLRHSPAEDTILLSSATMGAFKPANPNWAKDLSRLLADYLAISIPGQPLMAISRRAPRPVDVDQLHPMILDDGSSLFGQLRPIGDELPLDFDWRMYLYLHESARTEWTEAHAQQHWLAHRYPYKSYRTFDQIFQWETYLNKYEDLRAAGLHTYDQALTHFLQYGINEGRTC